MAIGDVDGNDNNNQGDFNENDDMSGIAGLCEKGLIDALFLTDQFTHHYAIKELDASPIIWKRLDHLFCSNCVPMNVSVLDEEFGSDHFLVLSTIKIE